MIVIQRTAFLNGRDFSLFQSQPTSAPECLTSACLTYLFACRSLRSSIVKCLTKRQCNAFQFTCH